MANALKFPPIYLVERIRWEYFTHLILKFYKDSSPMLSPRISKILFYSWIVAQSLAHQVPLDYVDKIFYFAVMY